MKQAIVALILVCVVAATLDAVAGNHSESPQDRHSHASDLSPDEWSRANLDLTDYFTREEMEEWGSFANTRRALSLISLFLSLLLYTVFAYTPRSEASDRKSPRGRLYSAARRLSGALARVPPFTSAPAKRIARGLCAMFGPDWAPAIFFTWIFLLAGALALLPLQMVAEQHARVAGLSVYSNPAWLWDITKGILMSAASMTFMVFGLFGLVRKLPRWWWLALGAPAAILMVGWGYVSQYQARVYYEFSELEDADLRGRFERLAERQDITLSSIKVIDAGRHTRAINAWVAGLGPTREIVLFDNALELLDAEELEAAIAHEMGHIDREKPALRYFLSGIVLIAALFLVSRLLSSAAPKHRFDGPGDPRSLPLLLLALTLAFLIVRPVERAWSRHEERLADQSGLMLTGKPEAFIRLQTALARHNLADVDPPSWAVFWFATHPPIAERIATAKWYGEWLASIANLPDGSSPASEETKVHDPYLWLEELNSDEALDWVRARNAITQSEIAGRPGFEALRSDLLSIFDSDDRIPYVRKRGDFYYNFWRDEAHPRGIWRRCTLDEYPKEEPAWEILLDLDALAEKENENWVWAGSHCLYPEYDRCLIFLSRGGADARVSREFDLESKSFVEDGFNLPEAKVFIGWIDRDAVYVGTDFGEGSLTESGYPRIAKRWRRGTAIDEAETILEGEVTDVSAVAWHDPTRGFERSFVQRAISFYESERFLIRESGELERIDLPRSASSQVFRDYLIVRPREDWEVGGRTFPAGSLLVTGFESFLAGSRDFDILFEPTKTTSLSSLDATLDHLIITVLDDVKSMVYFLTPSGSGWKRRALFDTPAMGTISISAVDSRESNAYFMTLTDYLTPTTLYLGEIGSAPEPLKALPSYFAADGLAVTQHFATSDDGTRVPYFMVAPEDLEPNGGRPTLLTGYGGFEISSMPAYSASVGRAWLESGGVHVVANIRGGGEYGPAWHRAALREKRHRAFEDFAAVARDLIERGVTSPERLGISGGSNGGLLVGNMITTYPELFTAAVCTVPLLDMRRFHLLLAGASWTAEYGNPDDPEDWAFIETFSPYHNLSEDRSYPTVLFNTSTRDDRVHPGHARKMMARMEELGHRAYYYENIEGGHGAASNNRQAAYRQALIYTFLKKMLVAGEPATRTVEATR